MIRKRLSKKILLLFIGDVLLLYAALWTTLAIRYIPEERVSLFQLHLFPFTLVFSVWLALIGAFGLYELHLLKNSRLFLYRLVQIMTINTILAIVIFYFFPFEIEPRRNLLLIVSIATALFFIWRSLFNVIIPRAPASRVIFLGINPETAALAAYLLLHPQLGYKPVAFVSHHEPVQLPLPSLSSLPSLILAEHGLTPIIHTSKAQVVVVSPEMKSNSAVVQELFSIIPMGLSMVDFPAFHEMLTGKIPLSLIAEAWFLENLIGIRKRSYEIGKRALDLALTILIAIPALILFPFIALAIIIESPGPLFFRQQRIGKNGTPFTLLKYRSTHRTTVPPYEGRHKEAGDVYTNVGTFIRRSYLDEVPQIINIFRGEMSFVGPRPERPEFVSELKKRVPFYDIRLLVTPGMTGWAQINMTNDASVEDAPEKMQYDLYYVKNRSFMLDLLIMLRTLYTLIRREGR